MESSAPPNLRKHLHILSPDQVELVKLLLDNGQTHLFQHWPDDPALDHHHINAFFLQVRLGAAILRSDCLTDEEISGETGDGSTEGADTTVGTGETTSEMICEGKKYK
ncbi:hypothetical protein ACFE04_017891 [Oxalis oulophora]